MDNEARTFSSWRKRAEYIPTRYDFELTKTAPMIPLKRNLALQHQVEKANLQISTGQCPNCSKELSISEDNSLKCFPCGFYLIKCNPVETFRASKTARIVIFPDSAPNQKHTGNSFATPRFIPGVE